MTRNDFLCPSCRGHLRPEDKLIFMGKTRSGQSGFVLLSPHLGEYTIRKHPSFRTREGEHLEFYCPLCHENIATHHEHINLVKIIMLTPDGKESEIVFSRIIGERCTYKIDGKEVEGYGPDSSEYRNFWGEGSDY